MEIPRSNQEIGVFMLAFVFSGILAMLGLVLLQSLPVPATGLASASNNGLLLGLLLLGVIAGFVAVERLRDSQ
ncbi:hypothetical protein K8R43_00680 [archaeon]|nr:hypothetical protein [archaeon]